MRSLALGAALLLTTGCSALGPAGMAFDAVTAGVGVYQAYKGRQEAKEQTAAIRELRDEIRAHRYATEELVNLLRPRGAAQVEEVP